MNFFRVETMVPVTELGHVMEYLQIRGRTRVTACDLISPPTKAQDKQLKGPGTVKLPRAGSYKAKVLSMVTDYIVEHEKVSTSVMLDALGLRDKNKGVFWAAIKTLRQQGTIKRMPGHRGLYDLVK